MKRTGALTACVAANAVGVAMPFRPCMAATSSGADTSAPVYFAQRAIKASEGAIPSFTCTEGTCAMRATVSITEQACASAAALGNVFTDATIRVAPGATVMVVRRDGRRCFYASGRQGVNPVGASSTAAMQTHTIGVANGDTIAMVDSSEAALSSDELLAVVNCAQRTSEDTEGTAEELLKFVTNARNGSVAAPSRATMVMVARVGDMSVEAVQQPPRCRDELE